MGPSRSPLFCNASLVSTNSLAPAKQASSASRILGVKLPIKSRWLPGLSQAPWTTGAVASVAQLTTSARATAAARSLATLASKPPSRSSSTSAFACDACRAHTCTASIGKTWRNASGTRAATRPAPTTSRRLELRRANIEAANAEAATVRRAVISLPSIWASGSPVRASYSTYVANKPGRPRAALPGKILMVLMPK